MTIFLLVAALKKGAEPAILLNIGHAAPGVDYIISFMLTMLMGSYTLVGFETSANLSEETVQAPKTVPRAIIASVALSGIFGLFFLIAATLAIPNINDVLASSNPLPFVIEANLGIFIGKLFLVFVCISIFACGLIIITSAGRLIYAMSRDGLFFFSRIFKKISPTTNSPVAATLLILVLSFIATCFAASLTVLVGATAVLPALIYLITVIAYGTARRKAHFKATSFTLGKFTYPIFALAILWLITEIGFLTIPKKFHQVTLVTGLLFIVGVIFYFLFFQKRMLRT